METVIVSTDPVCRPHSVGWLWDIWLLLSHYPKYIFFHQRFAKLLFSVSPEYWRLIQFLLGVRRGGQGKLRVMWKKINVFVLSLFRPDFVIIIIIIIIIEMNCFLIEIIFQSKLSAFFIERNCK